MPGIAPGRPVISAGLRVGVVGVVLIRGAPDGALALGKEALAASSEFCERWGSD